MTSDPRPLQSDPVRRYFPDIDTFKAAAQGADVVPVYRQLLADRLTPVTAFEVLGRDANAFLLESVVGGPPLTLAANSAGLRPKSAVASFHARPLSAFPLT